jgi:hypothetical protein
LLVSAQARLRAAQAATARPLNIYGAALPNPGLARAEAAEEDLNEQVRRQRQLAGQRELDATTAQRLDARQPLPWQPSLGGALPRGERNPPPFETGGAV